MTIIRRADRRWKEAWLLIKALDFGNETYNLPSPHHAALNIVYLRKLSHFPTNECSRESHFDQHFDSSRESSWKGLCWQRRNNAPLPSRLPSLERSRRRVVWLFQRYGTNTVVYKVRIEILDQVYLHSNPPCLINSLGKRKKREWATFLPLALDIISCSAAKTSQSEEHRPDRQRTTRTRGSSTSTSSPVRKRRRTHGSAAPSRNKQATTIDQEEYIRLKLSLCQVNRGGPNDLDCPVEGCHYIQMNGRMPDLRRHIRTHIRKDAEIRCKGVPWQDFMQHRHPFPTISDEQPYAVPNEDGLWIGGCLKTFSRADALKRHLRNTSCMGLDHKQHHWWHTWWTCLSNRLKVEKGIPVSYEREEKKKFLDDGLVIRDLTNHSRYTHFWNGAIRYYWLDLVTKEKVERKWVEEKMISAERKKKIVWKRKLPVLDQLWIYCTLSGILSVPSIDFGGYQGLAVVNMKIFASPRMTD